MPDATSIEVFFLDFAAAERGLRAAIMQAEAIRDNTALALDARLRSVALVQDLGEEHRELVDVQKAFKSTFTPINPPSDAVVVEGIQRAKELAALVADNLLAEGKLEAIIGVIDALGALATPRPADTGLAQAEINLAALRLAESHTIWLQGLRRHFATKPLGH